MGEPNRTVYLHYIAVSFVGSAAAVLAWVAEAKRIKAADVSMTELGKCKYPKSPASVLGYTAASLAFVNQIAICFVARYAYRATNDTNTRKFPFGAVFCLIISWVSSGIGIVLLIFGAYLNSRQEFVAATKTCYTLKFALFRIGGLMVLIGCSQGLCYAFYLFSANCHSATEQAVPYQSGIAMANSQVDAASICSNNLKQQQYV